MKSIRERSLWILGVLLLAAAAALLVRDVAHGAGHRLYMHISALGAVPFAAVCVLRGPGMDTRKAFDGFLLVLLFSEIMRIAHSASRGNLTDVVIIAVIIAALGRLTREGPSGSRGSLLTGGIIVAAGAVKLILAAASGLNIDAVFANISRLVLAGVLEFILFRARSCPCISHTS